MIIIDMCKERTCKLEDGTKIIYRKLPPKIFQGILLSNFNPKGNDSLHEEGDKKTPNIAEFEMNNAIVGDVLKHENSIVRWEGVTDEDKNELEFDPKYIDDLDTDIRTTLFNCIAPKSAQIEDNGELDPAEKKRQKGKSLKQ